MAKFDTLNAELNDLEKSYGYAALWPACEAWVLEYAAQEAEWHHLELQAEELKTWHLQPWWWRLWWWSQDTYRQKQQAYQAQVMALVQKKSLLATIPSLASSNSNFTLSTSQLAVNYFNQCYSERLDIEESEVAETAWPEIPAEVKRWQELSYVRRLMMRVFYASEYQDMKTRAKEYNKALLERLQKEAKRTAQSFIKAIRLGSLFAMLRSMNELDEETNEIIIPFVAQSPSIQERESALNTLRQSLSSDEHQLQLDLAQQQRALVYQQTLTELLVCQDEDLNNAVSARLRTFEEKMQTMSAAEATLSFDRSNLTAYGQALQEELQAQATKYLAQPELWWYEVRWKGRDQEIIKNILVEMTERVQTSQTVDELLSIDIELCQKLMELNTLYSSNHQSFTYSQGNISSRSSLSLSWLSDRFHAMQGAKTRDFLAKEYEALLSRLEWRLQPFLEGQSAILARKYERMKAKIDREIKAFKRVCVTTAKKEELATCLEEVEKAYAEYEDACTRALLILPAEKSSLLREKIETWRLEKRMQEKKQRVTNYLTAWQKIASVLCLLRRELDAEIDTQPFANRDDIRTYLENCLTQKKHEFKKLFGSEESEEGLLLSVKSIFGSDEKGHENFVKSVYKCLGVEQALFSAKWLVAEYRAKRERAWERKAAELVKHYRKAWHPTSLVIPGNDMNANAIVLSQPVSQRNTNQVQKPTSKPEKPSSIFSNLMDSVRGLFSDKKEKEEANRDTEFTQQPQLLTEESCIEYLKLRERQRSNAVVVDSTLEDWTLEDCEEKIKLFKVQIELRSFEKELYNAELMLLNEIEVWPLPSDADCVEQEKLFLKREEVINKANEINAAYRKLALLYHSDKLENNVDYRDDTKEKIASIFAQLNNSYTRWKNILKGTTAAGSNGHLDTKEVENISWCINFMGYKKEGSVKLPNMQVLLKVAQDAFADFINGCKENITRVERLIESVKEGFAERNRTLDPKVGISAQYDMLLTEDKQRLAEQKQRLAEQKQRLAEQNQELAELRKESAKSREKVKKIKLKKAAKKARKKQQQEQALVKNDNLSTNGIKENAFIDLENQKNKSQPATRSRAVSFDKRYFTTQPTPSIAINSTLFTRSDSEISTDSKVFDKNAGLIFPGKYKKIR